MAKKRITVLVCRYYILFFTCLLLSCQSDQNTVDLVIEDAWILTMKNDFQEYPQARLIIDQGKIIAIEDSSNKGSEYKARKVISAKGQLLIPGLVNTHTHAAMTLLRGYGDDHSLQDWLEKYMWPAEAAIMDSNAVYDGSLLAMAEMIRSGTTTINDMYFFADQVANAAQKSGIRAIVGEGILNFPTPSSPDPETALTKSRHLLEQYKNHPHIAVSLAPHSPYATGPAYLQEAAKIAQEYGCLLHIHVSETLTEQENMRSQHQQSPTTYLDSLGLFQARVLMAHGVHLAGEDINVLMKSKVGIAHCPESNMKLASGIAPVPFILESGIPLGLGTDGAASNNDLDLFEEMSTAAKLHKVDAKDPTVITAKTVLYMATMGGARALNLDEQIGSIEVGKKADLILIDLQSPHMQPIYDPYSQLVYSADGQDVHTVIVEGKILMENRKVLTIDEKKLFEKINQYKKALLNK